MKKALVIFVSLFSMMSAKAQYYHYDVNNDGFINMTDVTLIIDKILNKPNGYLECPDNNHPHMIDLGLPSGTKWACSNVDTTHPENQSPTNKGGYYAWGETEEKTDYSWNTYIHCDGSGSTCHDIGTCISGTEYDVATVKWGDSWQMPSWGQVDELKKNCTFTWTTVNGVEGGMYKSKKNGSTIFLPAAGYRRDNSIENSSKGYYRTGTWAEGNSNDIYFGFSFSGEFVGGSSAGRCIGRTVRPVSR